MTDNKATWWSVTAFNKEIETLEDVSSYPPEVVKVYGGRERCPTTGTEHFQGCIQLSRQVRLKWLKSWLPTANLSPARQKEALVKYAMKADTATGEKLERSGKGVYLKPEDVMLQLVKAYWDSQPDLDYGSVSGEFDLNVVYWEAVNIVLLEDPSKAGIFMNPSYKTLFVNTFATWSTLLQRKVQAEALEAREEADEAEAPS